MKKIGIITLYRNNFGSILQAYSTYSYLNSLGYDCSLIQTISHNRAWDKVKKIPILLAKCIRYREYFDDYVNLKDTIKKTEKLLSSQTRDLMDDFVYTTFKIEKCNVSNLVNLNNKYDFFVTGSDQVWSRYSKLTYLTFADSEKKVALAASFGVDKIKDYSRKDITKALLDFSNISVREEAGVKIVKEVAGKNAVRLADPTVLLDKNDWIKFSNKGMAKQNYILLHFLNAPNKFAIDSVNLYIKNHQCIVYCICNIYYEYHSLLDYRFIDINPYDYVSLIKNAEFIFTDSYHTTLFSLYLEKQFLTFERQYILKGSQNNRIDELLRRIGMLDRFVLNDTSIIDFDTVAKWNSDELFLNERLRVKEYIKCALKY